MRLPELLRDEAARRPALQPQDGVKLLYQRCFGCGHLLHDADEARRRLEEEYEATPADAAQPLFEHLGGGWSRLNLAAARAQGLPAALIARMFLASARPIPQGEKLEGLDELRQLAGEGVFAAFGSEELEAWLRDYPGGPVHHSEAYREAYHPAYRVVDARLEALLPLLVRVEAQRPRRVAIDGRAASGKTTAAYFLSEMYGYEVVHMDDFFLPPPMRTEARLAEPGGNVHYERFRTQVLEPLSRNESFRYGVFSCSRGELTGEKAVDGTKPVLVEGAYSQRPDFGRPYDLTVFYDIAPGAQRSRLLVRNGPEMTRRFEERWIPLEERYHSACHTRERADLVLTAAEAD